MNHIDRYTLRACVDIGVPIERLTDDTYFRLWASVIVGKLIADRFNTDDIITTSMLSSERHLIHEIAKRLRVIYRDDVPCSWNHP